MWSRVLRVAMLTALWGLGDLQGTTTVKPGRGKGSNWWGIAKAGEPNNLLPLSPGQVHMDSSVLMHLRKKQRRLVQENVGVIEAISKGAKLAIEECQHQFKNRQWNCSTTNYLKGKDLFGKVVDIGCRETAFIYAITSAAVTYSVAKACAEGSIVSCNCDYRQGKRSRISPNSVTGAREWQRDGCSDNIGFGFKFSREFVDAGEKGRNDRELMNLHNNEAGRLLVNSSLRRECKCHGMSGSCTTKTCWWRAPNFRVIGDSLRDRFDGASHVQAMHSNGANTRGPRRKRNRYKPPSQQFKPFNPNYKSPTRMDLVYFEDSPPFCEHNPRLGILGTTGRVCNGTSLGTDGCDLMCCGRGQQTQEVMVRERCNCTFQWCCEVKCNICNTKKIVHTCN